LPEREVGPDFEEKITPGDVAENELPRAVPPAVGGTHFAARPEPQQERIGFGFATAAQRQLSRSQAPASSEQPTPIPSPASPQSAPPVSSELQTTTEISASALAASPLPPLDSATKFVREMTVESLSSNIRPLGQLDESFIIATDDEGLLLIDQHVAHERVLFDKYRALEASRRAESQQMLIPETFDLTPAQAAAFDAVAEELESYGFELMRLSGRTVAIKSAPADLPASEARNVLSEVLDTVDSEKRGVARATLREEIAASLACHAAIKVNMPLAPEKMRWLIDRLLMTSSPTTCPHGRPVILRLATQDILKGFHRI
jgi:DNA mismatch repair protein MutL